MRASFPSLSEEAMGWQGSVLAAPLPGAHRLAGYAVDGQVNGPKDNTSGDGELYTPSLIES
jgi:hypothetical protein